MQTAGAFGGAAIYANKLKSIVHRVIFRNRVRCSSFQRENEKNEQRKPIDIIELFTLKVVCN